MEKDLREYLDNLSGKVDRLSGNMDSLSSTVDGLSSTVGKLSADVAEIKETMATKKELGDTKKSLTKEIRRVEKKSDKKLDNLLEYAEAVDKDISDHRRNTEMHNVKMRKA